MRAIASTVLFTLTATPLLGGITGTLAAAETVQNTTWQYQYDANGNLTQITDPFGHVTNQSFDALNRLKQQLQPAPAAGGVRPAIGYGYNALDQLTKVTDPRNLATATTFDGLGNPTALTSPDTGVTTSTYDAAGNLKTSTDARGLTTTITYDALNRITQIAYASGTATQFAYDGGATPTPAASGSLSKMTDESGQTTYAYDAFGLPLTKVQTVGAGTGAKSFTLNYTYGASGSATGKLTGMTYASGNRINLSYDTAGRINGIALNPTNANGQGANTGSTIPLLIGIDHQPFGPVRNWTWGNSSLASVNTYARGFDLDGRLTSYPLGNGVNNGTQRTIAYDAASRIGAYDHAGTGAGSNAPANFNQRFQYDNLDRLNGMVGNGTNQGFQYDLSGNRTQATFGGTTYGNTIAADSNRLTATAGPAPAKSNLYDAAGNLLSDGTAAYTYSARGRMSSAQKAGSTVMYLYNGFGQRVKKSGPTSIIATGANFYVYDEAEHLIGEYDANGKMMQETVYLGDLPVAVLKQTVTGTAPNQVTATNVYYAYADHLNTPRVITRATDNKIVWRWDNADPFGMQSPNENPSALGIFTYNPRFPGQVFDRETNLHYNYYRDYDSSTGRYIESDPIGLKGGVNTYAYVGGNPVSYTDRLGLRAKDMEDPTNLFACKALRHLVAADEKMGAKNLVRSSEYSAFGSNVSDLNSPFESVIGPVDIDWMLRTSAYGLGSNEVVGTMIFGSSKIFWNITNPVVKITWLQMPDISDFNPFAQYDDPSYTNAPKAASLYLGGGKRMKDIFAPALKKCECKGY